MIELEHVAYRYQADRAADDRRGRRRAGEISIIAAAVIAVRANAVGGIDGRAACGDENGCARRAEA